MGDDQDQRPEGREPHGDRATGNDPAPVRGGLRIPVGAPGRRRPGDEAVGDDRERPTVASVHDAVGGQPFFDELAARFYEEVRTDPTLLALYPDPEDLGPAAERLALFLAQYWGGPTTYSDRRGHPRLRMRHAPYRIDLEARDRWLRAMTTALTATLRPDGGRVGELAGDDLAVVERQFLEYFTAAADHLVNDPS